MAQPTPAVDVAREPRAQPPVPAAPRARHRFKFHRAGGLDQVALETGADLLALEDLHHWPFGPFFWQR